LGRTKGRMSDPAPQAALTTRGSPLNYVCQAASCAAGSGGHGRGDGTGLEHVELRQTRDYLPGTGLALLAAAPPAPGVTMLGKRDVVG